MLSDLRENCAVALFNPDIITTVLDIFMENVPDLRALDLSENNLSLLDSLVVLALRFSELKILHIGRNLVGERWYTVSQFVACVSACVEAL
jgi:hypothetical protein